MKYLTASTGSQWVDTAIAANATQAEKDLAEQRHTKIQQLFTDVLMSEQLVVLTGLGPSLSVKDAKGTVVAPTMTSIWKAAATKAGTGFDALKQKVRYKTPSTGDNIELLLSHCQLVQALDPSLDVGTFIAETEALIVSLCRFLDNSELDLSIHSTFLRKVARRSPRKPRMKLFTTNYDLCFETAASTARFIVVDGFSHTQPQHFDGTYFNYDFVLRQQEREAPDYISNVFQLFKLHGSVDWERSKQQILKNPKCEKPLIIYPRLSKFESSYDQPFLEMMSRFQASLRQPNTGLLICGFGFNDTHIAEPVIAAIEANVGLKTIVVDPSTENSTNAYIKRIAGLINQGDWRLTLVCSKFEEVVPMIPELVAQSEMEIHRQRMSAGGGKP